MRQFRSTAAFAAERTRLEAGLGRVAGTVADDDRAGAAGGAGGQTGPRSAVGGRPVGGDGLAVAAVDRGDRPAAGLLDLGGERWVDDDLRAVGARGAVLVGRGRRDRVRAGAREGVADARLLLVELQLVGAVAEVDDRLGGRVVGLGRQ